MTTASTNTSKKPVYRKQLPGGISAAVFEKVHDGKVYRSVNIQRSYLKDKEWQRMSIYLDHQDIPFMQEALNAAWNYLNNNLGIYTDPDNSATDVATMQQEA